jgi:hypothetical protein
MTTHPNHRTASRTHRLLAVAAAAGLATVVPVVFSAPAQAADANTQVWVCKYVRTPGGDEVLKDGKNPIEVNGKSVDKDKDGQIFVGDQFADAQGRSVVVQIGGEDPGAGSCSPTPPPVVPTDPTTPSGPGTPGTTAPKTGGAGSDTPVGLLAGGVLLVGAGVLTAEAARRRRSSDRP